MTFHDRMAKMAAKQLQAEQRRVYNRKWRAEHALRIATEEEAELKEFAQALANASEDGVAPEFARAEARIERTMAKSKRLFDVTNFVTFELGHGSRRANLLSQSPNVGT